MKNSIFALKLIGASLFAVTCQANDAVIKLNELPNIGSDHLNAGGGAISISAGTGEKTAYIRLGSIPTQGNSYKWDFAVQTPIDSNDKPSTQADFNGISSSTNLQINVTGIAIDAPVITTEYAEALEKLCQERLADPNWKRGCGTGDITTEVYRKAKKLDADEIVRNEDLDGYKNKFLRERERLRDELEDKGIIKPVNAHFYGLQAKYGRENFSYQSPTTLETVDVSKSPWAITGYYSYKNDRAIYGIGAEYQESYTESSAGNLCTPNQVPSDSLSCSKLGIGEPIQIRRKLIYGEFRYAPREMNFAVAPKLTYDFESEETGLLFPIYLLQDISGGLTGGVSFGWQSETDEIDATVFVGKGFSFW